jgi:hypothetical protein
MGLACGNVRRSRELAMCANPRGRGVLANNLVFLASARERDAHMRHNTTEVREKESEVSES